MQTGFRLNLEQTQKLVMTPELCQAINVLQLSSLELSNYIDRQLEENPLLELRDYNDNSTNDNSTEVKQDVSFNWEDYLNDAYQYGRQGGVVRGADPQRDTDYGYDRFLYRSPTLFEYLMSQLSLSPCRGRDKWIGEFLIGSIDDNGYLRIPLAEVQEVFAVDLLRVERVLFLLQSFEPVGIAARDLQECLLIQLRYLGLEDTLAGNIIKHHLANLSKGRLVKIAHELGVSIQEVQRASDLIKTLDPKPGRNFTGLNEACYIVPDVVLEKVDGEYVILVDDVTLPRLTVNATYRSVLNREKQVDSDIRRFVENKLNAAVWLIRSLEQRRLTLYKVASCLVELQRDFLEKGIKFLKPLNLKKVAQIVGVHESTISRATANKYIQTPRGVFEMKCFFSTGVNNNSGSKVSAGCAKEMLQELIDKEDRNCPFTDQKLAEMLLNDKGIKISRRTVAKYRYELNIPAVQKRKRY